MLALPGVPGCLYAGLHPHSSAAALRWVYANNASCGTIVLSAQLMLLYLLIYVFCDILAGSWVSVVQHYFLSQKLDMIMGLGLGKDT